MRVKDQYNDDILTHLNQPQHILNDPKTLEEVWMSFVLSFCMATYFVNVSTEATLPNGAKLTGCLGILGQPNWGQIFTYA